MSYPLEDPRNPWAYHWFIDRRCPKCGEQVSPTDNYCPNCGYKLRKKPPRNNKTELTEKGLAILYIVSVLLGIPASLIFFYNFFKDAFVGFNWFLFIFWTLTIGAAIGFAALLFFVIFVAIIKKLVNR
jgi:predicted nucleic acid-binding Zn ribbon protein